MDLPGTVLFFGFGYSARYTARLLLDRGYKVFGTTRDTEKVVQNKAEREKSITEQGSTDTSQNTSTESNNTMGSNNTLTSNSVILIDYNDEEEVGKAIREAGTIVSSASPDYSLSINHPNAKNDANIGDASSTSASDNSGSSASPPPASSPPSSPPSKALDPVLYKYRTAIEERIKTLNSTSESLNLIYLSTSGVYGDHGGDWVDENTHLGNLGSGDSGNLGTADSGVDSEKMDSQKMSSRSRNRILAELAWLELAGMGEELKVEGASKVEGSRTGESRNVDQVNAIILRLAGIYGPEKHAVKQLQEGKLSRSIYKEGQVFNRSHVVDTARAIAGIIRRNANTNSTSGESDGKTNSGAPIRGVFNLCDDLPASPVEVHAEAARLLSEAPPEITPFEEATLSPMGKEFYMNNKRVSNKKLKTALSGAAVTKLISGDDDDDDLSIANVLRIFGAEQDYGRCGELNGNDGNLKGGSEGDVVKKAEGENDGNSKGGSNTINAFELICPTYREGLYYASKIDGIQIETGGIADASKTCSEADGEAKL